MKIQSNIPNSRDFKVVSDALRAIPFPLPDYNDWARIGLALYASFGMDGMQLLYDVSCAPFPEYRNETPEKLAAKFRTANGSVTLGTVFHFARQNGWKRKQPTKIQNEDWHLVAWHDYRDAEGNLAYRMNRLVSPDGKEKRMTIERYENGKRKFDLPDELRLPYNLPQVREAIQKGETIYFVEGESDADALAANERTATCVPFGAGGWNKRYVEHFKGASICFIPDNDKTGKALPLRAIPDLLSVAKEVKVIELSDAKDVRELINEKGIQTFQSLTPIDATQYLAKHKSKHKLPEAYPPTRLKVKLDFDPCPKCDSSTLDIFMQEGMYFLKCLRCDFSKPVIEFRDNLDEGKMEFKCPKCGFWQEHMLPPCESCGYTTDKFKIIHESTLRHEVAVSDNPMLKYPLQKLNSNPSELDVDESAPDAIEKIVPEKVFEFDDGLIQQGTVFEELFRRYSRNEIPPQFAFAGTIATISAVIGTRVKIKFNDQLLKCNDYYVLLSESGTGKTTIVSSVFNLLERLEGKIIHDSGVNIFLYPTDPTERAIIDVMREATSVEKEKGIKRTPQPSGLFVCDEITSLFTEMTQKHSANLDTLILKLWDGKAMIRSTSFRHDGKFRVPESALTILGSSTPSHFRSKMPKTAFSDGMLARMNFILELDDTKPLKTIGKHVIQSNPFNDKGIAEHVIEPNLFDDKSSALIETLLKLYQFVEQTRKLVVTTDAVYTEEKNADRWSKEKKEYTENEAIKVYYNRIVARMWKYSIILSACRALALNEDKITIDAEIMQHAAKIADFFKAQFIYFVQKSAANDKKGLDTIGRIKAKAIELLSGRFAKKGATFRDLMQFTNASKANLTTALNELCEAGLVLTIQEIYKGRDIARYFLPKHSQTDTSKLSYNG